ncbi:MAG: ATP-binding protein [Candidatus Bathyarchaeia archaeon]|jgi:AAA+ ATPase superfamily predicted ATPase
MRFYDREAELTALEKAYSTKGSEMIVVSGRRRIGKSRLIDEFLKDKERTKILIVPKEEKQVAVDFAEAFSDGYTPSFNSVESALEYFFNISKKRTLYIDEFPNLLDVDPSIPYAFQRVWEKYKDKTAKVLIVSGSYVSMMNRIFTQQKAPLFNRAGYTIVLQPLSLKVVWEIQTDLGIGATEKIGNYCILGGIPYYYELVEKRAKRDVVNELFFDVAAPLKEEGQNVLRQEFGAGYKKYFSIIEAIGAGVVSGSEIANKLGLAQTTLSKYIVALQRDFQLIERTVPFGQNLQRSKKGVYSIKDNTIAFWFTNVYGKPDPPTTEKLNEFTSKRFEIFCKDFLTQYLKGKGETIVRTGRWWGQVEVNSAKFEDREIDVVVETQTSLYIGECKWTNKKVTGQELNRLGESSTALKTKKPIRKVLFSKTGFEFSEPNAGTMLFDPIRIETEIAKLV